MEGITKLSTDQLISLSEQELVDCDIEGIDQDCGSGLMDDAFQFIKVSLQKPIIHTRVLMELAMQEKKLTM